MKGGWVMYVILACIVVAMLRNAAGATAITMGVGAEANQLAQTLSGAGITVQKGSFNTGNTKITLG